MTIDFYGKEIGDYERFHAKPYTGYFTPNGKLVDFNTDLGGSHGNLANIVSWTFLFWVKNSPAFKDVGLKNVKMMASIDMETGVIRDANVPIKEFNEKANLLKLQRDLLLFLSVAEKNPEFVSWIKECIHPEDLPEYIRKNKALPFDTGESIYEIERVFGRKNTRTLLLRLKDICTRYLGYDSIEQVDTEGKYLKVPELIRFFPEDYPVTSRPRKITTPNNSIHKRFFNYLLMDWKIDKVSRMIYNDLRNEFEEEPRDYSYQSDSDESYEKEIVAIKKMVPLKDREKYFI